MTAFFEEIIEHLDDELVCSYRDCQGSVQFHVSFHECARHEWCGFHAGALVQMLRQGFSEFGKVRCAKCVRDFYEIAELVTVVPI